MHAQEFNCFGAREGEGNPALVVEDNGMDAHGRQAFARERRTTCVFVDKAPDRRVDYFYPHMRSPLCLHATLAVAALLFGRCSDADERSLHVETAVDGLRLELLREGNVRGLYFIRLQPQAAPSVEATDAQIAALLRASAGAVVSRPRVASVGSPKLLVEVANREALYSLAPDLSAIVAWGKESGVNGMFAYYREAPGIYEGRNFNHLDPECEDSATGVAAGALAIALGREFGQELCLRQGHATGRDCRIHVRRDGESLLIGGLATSPNCKAEPVHA